MSGSSDGLTIQLDLGPLADQIAQALLASLEERLPMPSPWLDVSGAADYLSCSPERIRKLIQSNRIPYHRERTGARVFLHRRELDEWLLAI